MTEPTDIKKGLAGVVVDYTAVSKVNPDTNSLLYRGYPVQELAATQPFEAVAYLLWYGELPDRRAARRVHAPRSAPTAPLDDAIKQAIDLLPLEAHPMDVAAHGRVAWSGHPIPPRTTPRASPTSARRGACSRSCRPSSPTTSAAGAARSSSSRATTSTTRTTSSG